jgi:hypothetical protein
METCRICGETKAQVEFKHVPNFTRYWKKLSLWCQDCQKMYLELRRSKERVKKVLVLEQKFEVSFE